LFLFHVFTAVVALSEQELQDMFVAWTHKHNKVYSVDEFQYRWQTWKNNALFIESFNQQGNQTFTVAMNKFGDLTVEEFAKIYLGFNMKNTEAVVVAEVAADPTIPASIDWRQKGAVTQIKNQGQCGSCWSFSTTGNVEGQWFLAGNQLVGLSEQNLVDCDHECTTYQNQQSCDAGCDGGLQPNAYTYIIKNGGIDTESSYPYEAVDDTCRFNPSNVGAKISNWTFVSSNETEMAAYLVAHGPLAIAADAVEWQFYFGGVFYAPCGDQLDHGILIVGYGTETDIFDQTMPYWIVKNSWGEDWGDSGYLYIERGDGLCGLNQYVTSSIINK